MGRRGSAYIIYFAPFAFVSVGASGTGKAGEEPLRHDVDGVDSRTFVKSGLAGGDVEPEKVFDSGQSGRWSLVVVLMVDCLLIQRRSAFS
jgi:hypothetical protein